MVTRTEGPFEYWEVTGDAVRSAAECPGTNAAVIQSLAGELEGDEQKAAAAIEGDIEAGVKANTTAAKDLATSLAAKGTYAVGLLGQFGKAVDAFDESVNQINIDYKNQVQSKISAARTKADQEATGNETPAAVDTAAIAGAVRADLQARYHKAEGVIDDAADEIASMFKAGPTDANVKDLLLAGLIPFDSAKLYPGVKLTPDQKRQALSNTLKGMAPSEQAQYVKDHKDIDPEVIKVISPEAQTIIANDVADDIEDEEIDSETVRLLGLFKDQQAFAHQLYTSVSPNEMADAIAGLEKDAFPSVAGVSGTNDTKELYKNFLTGAGTALATYTKADGEYGPSDPKDLATTWFTAITDDDNEENAAALTLLIKAGGHETEFEPTFLTELTGKVYEWERDQDGAVWGPRNEDFMDPFADVQSSVGAKSGLIDYTSGFAVDGLANLLGGMENSPEAAKDFFHGRYDGIDDEPSRSLNDTMDYLVGGEDGRTWDADDNSDNGDGLGRALAAATVGEEHRTVDGTQIANKLFENIEKYGGEPDGRFTDEWHVGPEMTDSLGLIASGYTGDIYDELAGHGATSGATHLDLGDDPGKRLSQFLGELGRPSDKTGLETLTAAMLLQAKSEISEQLSSIHGPHTIDNLMGAGLEGTQQRNGKVMGLLLTEGLSLAADEDKSEEERAAIMSKAIDVTSSFIPGAGTLLGEGAKELSKMSVDFLKDEAITQLKAGIEAAPDTDAYLKSTAMSIDEKIQMNAIDSLIQHGYLGPQDTEKYGHWDGLGKDAVVGDPPHLDPRLYDKDGHTIDTSKMSDTDEAAAKKAQAAWTAYNHSQPSSQVLTLTGQSQFMKYFIDPKLAYDK